LTRTALIYDEVFREHNTGSHPENASRVEQVHAYLKSQPVFKRLLTVAPRPASEDELLLVHSKSYIDFIRSLQGDKVRYLDPDTVFGPGSLEAALSASGAVVKAVEDISRGSYDRAFCLVRPPGHHANVDRAMGFCIFNNVAVGTAFAARRAGLERPAIIDFDVHHGNGTQDIFYEDGDVLYCSMHEWPFYPGTGSPSETGLGEGEGKTVNVPLPGASGIDEYMDALRDTILPAVRRHRPAIIFLSAGFDADRADPIGGMDLTADGYGEITGAIVEYARDTCDGRIVSALEGGYNVKALSASVHAHLEALLR
jgi:acetoin utilization deacetylase AcuC-like enzyme